MKNKMKKIKLTMALFLSIGAMLQAQTFVEANSLTGFNNTFTGVSITISDVNSDGYPDVLFFIGETVYLYTNSGTNFTEVLGTPFVGIDVSSIAISDVNGDSRPDVLITGKYIAKLYTNSGTNFTELLGTPFVGEYEGSIAFSDINNDGRPDVLITGYDSGDNRMAILYTNSGTNFSKCRDFNSSKVFNSSIAFSDVNNDGKPV